MSSKNKKPTTRIIPRWKDVKNVRKNWKTVRGSPVASLHFALQVRKLFVAFIIIYIIYMGYDMVVNYNQSGTMGMLGRVVLTLVLIWVCYKIYMTIPQAKKQLEYYRRNPQHNTVNKLNVKQEIDDILDSFEKKKVKGGENDKWDFLVQKNNQLLNQRSQG